MQQAYQISPFGVVKTIVILIPVMTYVLSAELWAAFNLFCISY